MQAFHLSCVETNAFVPAAQSSFASNPSLLKDVSGTELWAPPHYDDSYLNSFQYSNVFIPQEKPLYQESTTPHVHVSPKYTYFETTKGGLKISSLPFKPSSSSVPYLCTLSRSTTSPENVLVCPLIPENTSGMQNQVSISLTLSSPSLSSDGATKHRARSPSDKDDSLRRNKVKTELCMHYVNNNPCPFGAGCTYAHGEEELQLTKLMDLHRAGLADAKTYRTKPCLTWVSTGSCPFGIRCTGIHDPRVAGTQPSWLPHTETQGNTIDTDINVESLHQKRLNAMLHNNPFGEQFSLDLDNYEDLYKLICNQTEIERKRSALSDRYKIEIALKMRGNSDWQFKFRPQHIIYDEVCMVLQKRAFQLTEDGVVELDLDAYCDSKGDHVLVREIAFGPDCDTAVRPVSLWFDIDDPNVKFCTAQQAKRYRYSQESNNLKKKNQANKVKSLFDSKDSFVMIRPPGKDAYDFTTAVLRHQLKVIQDKIVSKVCPRDRLLDVLDYENLHLKATFENLSQQWVAWSWWTNRDNTKVDDNTPVPKVDVCYSNANINSINETAALSSTQKIWQSFVASSSEEPDSLSEGKKRLPVFDSGFGSSSSPLACTHSLPHITKRLRTEDFNVLNKSAYTSLEVKGKCWKALLIRDKQELNEWEAVKQHFQNSRSKKVLSILQQ